MVGYNANKCYLLDAVHAIQFMNDVAVVLYSIINVLGMYSNLTNQ